MALSDNNYCILSMFTFLNRKVNVIKINLQIEMNELYFNPMHEMVPLRKNCIKNLSRQQ